MFEPTEFPAAYGASLMRDFQFPVRRFYDHFARLAEVEKIGAFQHETVFAPSLFHRISNRNRPRNPSGSLAIPDHLGAGAEFVTQATPAIP